MSLGDEGLFAMAGSLHEAYESQME